MKEILDVIHKTIYQFFDVCEDDEEVPMSDKDKLLLEVNKAICNNLKALEQEHRWIPVTERLPEVNVDVFVTDNGGGVPTVTMDACGIKDDTGDRFWYISQTPIAWMPLPEPYKAESEKV